MTRTTQQLLELGLPKWPQMLVTGRSVTVEQAKEIIFATDRFLTDPYPYSGGNAHDVTKWYRKTAGLDRFDDDNSPDFHTPEGEIWWQRRMRWINLVDERLDHLPTEYVRNRWASCAFIWGPHGWCSPKGEIKYLDNVGKWPDICTVLEDWQRIAERFPYLDLTATLMSGEDGDEDAEPVVNIRVERGLAELQEPDITPHLENGVRPRRNWDSMGSLTLLNSGRELGLPENWYREFAARVREVTDSITEVDIEQEKD